ncbi:MAG TPA: YceI family protein [Bacteroidia bacterium]|nr:YceI family protein [Bacteroidia bacterium]HNU34702.1 YceI family protein [Bacteroidia bacterium]
MKHLMITNVTGSFAKYQVTAETDNEDFMSADISFIADVNSVTTNNEQRDGHLKGADFFDTEKFPQIKFKATKYEDIDHDGSYELYGDLTIKDITKSIKLDVEFGGLMKDPWGNVKAGFTINGKINRKDWGLNWNAPLETGGVLVSEEVRISCEIQLVKQG